MAELEKLLCTDSKVESLKKINAIIEKGGGGLEIGDIGIAPLGIDESKGKRRYLNGQVIIQDQYTVFTDKLKKAIELYPSLACTESEWQTTATMTVGGQVGKFVVDNEAGTIRLPKIIMPIQGLTDLSKLGEIVSAGLPNITGTSQALRGCDYLGGGSGAIYMSSTTNGSNASTNANVPIINFDASRSNPIYGNSNTVQQEQIQYPYFIQVATGAETEDNIINEIELNNPFSLLDYKFSEYELNNLSWLRSEGQYNSKAVYPAVYELLLKIYNGTETKAGVSVKLATEEYTDYDFVLNTAEETFRLPIKVKLASGKAVVGNGMTLGLESGSNEIGLVGLGSNISGNIGALHNFYGTKLDTVFDSMSTYNLQLAKAGVTTDPTKSGLELSDSDLYLYFYVGETVQNANLINAGRIEEKVASLIPDNASLISGWGMPSSKYIDLTLGASGTTYTAPANGYITLAIPNMAVPNGRLWITTNVNRLGIKTTPENPTGGGGSASAFIPILKGESFTVGYVSTNTRGYMFRFIYAQGEV